MPDTKTTVTVVTAPGRIDHYNAHYGFRRPLNDAILRGAALVVADLNQVAWMDSLAIGILVGASKLCAERGTRFGVACSSEAVLRVFRRMALADVFDIRGSVGEFEPVGADPDCGCGVPGCPHGDEPDENDEMFGYPVPLGDDAQRLLGY